MLCHDPRISDDPTVKVETTNPALILAEMAREMFPDREVVWSDAAAAADYCEQAYRRDEE